MNLRKRGKC